MLNYIFLIIILGLLIFGNLDNIISLDNTANWTHSAFDQENSGFNPQTIINKNNIQDLSVKWLYHFESPPEIFDYVPPEGIQTTPLIHNGIIYVASGYNQLYAIEASEGRPLWSFTPPLDEYSDKKFWARRLATRSLTIYQDLIYMQTSDCSIYGFELTTGEIVFNLPDTCSNIPGNSGQYFGTFAPVFFDNLLITRAQGNAFGGRGFVSAYDIDTQELVWQWYSVPPEGGDNNWGRAEHALGNIEYFPGDWGDSNLIAGGTSWGLMPIDEDDEIIYLITGEPANSFDASLRPGPNLFSSSIIALDIRTGKIQWYFQISTHDITNNDPGWKLILADIDVNGMDRKVVLASSKSNYLYVLDAKTGDLIFDPIHFGSPNLNTINDNAWNNADMFASQTKYIDSLFCPSHLGGVFAGMAFAYNTAFIPTQNICGTVIERKLEYKNEAIDGFIYRLNLDLPTNGTIFAIDLSNGDIKWETDFPDRFQSASLAVSGDVLYAIDRSGVFYGLDATTGKILKEIPFNAMGGSGVAIGSDIYGDMMIVFPIGGGTLTGNKPGILVALSLDDSRTNQNSNNMYALIALILLVAYLFYVLIIQKQMRK